jgi:hypothetical protein
MTSCWICSVPSKMSIIVEGATVAAPRTVTWLLARDCMDVVLDFQPNWRND